MFKDGALLERALVGSCQGLSRPAYDVNELVLSTECNMWAINKSVGHLGLLYYRCSFDPGMYVSRIVVG